METLDNILGVAWRVLAIIGCFYGTLIITVLTLKKIFGGKK